MIDTLHLGLSYNCNMNCNHCFVNKKEDNLNINRLKETIKYLDKHGLFFVIYTFGEPLLSKAFWDIAQYISSMNIIQTLMTNGSLINNNNIELLKKFNINNIYISFDSVDEKKHDINRNYKGSYIKAINSLDLLLKSNFNVGIAVTINDSNVKEMPQFLDLAKQYNVKNISFLRQRNNGILNDLKNYEIYEKFYETYLTNYDENRVNILFHDSTLLLKTKQLYMKNKISKTIYEKYIDMNSCHYDTTISIEPNGNIKHCNLINNSIGNINQNRIEDVLKKEIKNENIIYCAKLSK